MRQRQTNKYKSHLGRINIYYFVLKRMIPFQIGRLWNTILHIIIFYNKKSHLVTMTLMSNLKSNRVFSITLGLYLGMFGEELFL